MAMPHSPITSRFSVLPAPSLSPGKCLCCGAHNRPVVDMGTELNVEGFAFRVYMCVLCSQDMHEQVKRHLIETGELESEAQHVKRYLDQHGYKVITNEQYSELVAWATGSSAVIDDIVDIPLNDEEDAEGESGDNPADEPVESGDSEDADGGNDGLDFGISEDSSKPRSDDLWGLDFSK